jgi:[protein-PII] uridylyltransferase
MSDNPSFSDSIVRARQQLHEGRERIKQQHEGGSPGIQVCTGISDLFDQIVLSMYELAIAQVVQNEEQRARLEQITAIVPHGGYGRRDVASYSDIDLMLLCQKSDAFLVPELARALSQNIYDVGLQLGFATRNIKEASSLGLKDAKIFTSLVESRFLTGSKELYSEFFTRFRRRSRNRWKQLIKMVYTARHEERLQYGDTVHLLKPNIKRSRGTLRDLQFVRWIGFIVHGEAEPVTLQRLGVLTREDYRTLRNARDFLLQLRNELHFQAGKSQDVLNRFEQVRIAEKSGYENNTETLAVEQFMQHYFEHISQVRYTVTHFFQSSRPQRWSSKLSLPGFVRKLDGKFRMGPYSIGALPNQIERIRSSLSDVIRLMELASEYNRRIDHRTWTAIRETMMEQETVELTDPVIQQFLSLLARPIRLGEQLRKLHQMRVLEKIVPAVKHARNLLQFNDYHKYTVDEHSMRAVKKATDFFGDNSVLGSVYRELGNKTILHLALLIHDLGKGFPEDHSEVGREIAEQVAKRFELTDHNTDILRHLVHKHLLMAHTAFRQDLHDENVVIRFAAEARSLEQLQMLFVLTCADLAAVGPGVLNKWKQDLITELYLKARIHLSGESQAKFAKDWLVTQQTKLLKLLPGDARKWESHLAKLPPSLLNDEHLTRSCDYLTSLAKLSPNEVVTWARYVPERNATEYTIGAHQKTLDGCFHRITGVLSSQRNSILGAEIFSLADELVLDRFFVSDLDYAQVPTNDRLSLIQQKVRQTIQLKEDINPAFRQVWSASSETTAGEINPLPSRVGIDNKSAQQYTIITVFAYDRLGLLYKITKALFDLELDVHVAKIGTYIDQVVDVFYVTDRNGNKIESKEQFDAIREKLLKQIEKPA